MGEIAYKRTRLGQAIYDIYFTRIVAKKVAKKHRLAISFVQQERLKWNPQKFKR